MALDQSALSELLGALRAGGGQDVVRQALAYVLQAFDRRRGRPGHRRWPLRARRDPHHPPQWVAFPAAIDQGR
jgi:hypothetical protein